MIDEKQGFLYLFFIIFLLALVGYLFDKISKASKKKKREKDIKDYLNYLKDNNYKFYEYYKNPHNRDKAFYLKSAIYQASKGFKINEKVLQYAKDNNLTNIPTREVKKIMRKNKVSY